MDADRLDALARTLAATGQRRTLLRLLTGGALGLAIWQRAEPAQVGSAKKRKKKKKRKKSRQTLACPAVCPFCQSCNAATGQCVSQNGQPGQDCVAPKVCCSGACCHPIHACNLLGTCATCAQVCPDTCSNCFHLAEGSTVCGDSHVSYCSSAPCSSTAECSAGQVCLARFTNRTTNFTGDVCPVPGGHCSMIAACS